MLRKIRIDQLRPGMYVSRMDTSWLKVSLFRPRIDTPEEVENLKKQGIREVYIDVRKGDDLPPAELGPVETVVRTEMVSWEKEIATARKVFTQAQQEVARAMETVRSGGGLELEPLERTVEHMLESLLRNPDALTGLALLRDKDTAVFKHGLRVSVFTLVQLNHLGFSFNDMKAIGLGALLHDIGKLRLTKALLDKTTPFTPDEYEVYKRHALDGAKMLEETGSFDKNTLLILLQHHERQDGTGFPRGISGDQISDLAKIVAIADSFDNVMNKPQFSETFTPHTALEWLKQWGGSALDGRLVNAFASAMGIYPVGSLVRLSDQRMGIVVGMQAQSTRQPRILVIFDPFNRLLDTPEELDLDQASSNRKISVVADVNPDKIGFDLAGYVRKKGLFSASPSGFKQAP